MAGGPDEIAQPHTVSSAAAGGLALPLSDAVDAALAQLGVAQATRLVRARANTALVWARVAGVGEVAVRATTQRAKLARERAALESVAAGAPPVARVPRVIARVSGAADALATTWLPGRCVAALLTPSEGSPVEASSVGASPDADRLAPIFEAAGVQLRALHGAAVPPDALPLRDALAQRLERWGAAAGPRLDADERGLVSQAAAALDAPSLDVDRVLAHRDYVPRNWVWDADAGLGVVDFEHARPDHPWVDLARAFEELDSTPRLVDALVAGYAPQLPPHALRADRGFALLRVLHALGTIARAGVGGDAVAEQRARRSLREAGPHVVA